MAIVRTADNAAVAESGISFNTSARSQIDGGSQRAQRPPMQFAPSHVRHQNGFRATPSQSN